MYASGIWRRRHWRGRFLSVASTLVSLMSSMLESAITLASLHGGTFSFWKQRRKNWNNSFGSAIYSNRAGNFNLLRCFCWTSVFVKSGSLPSFSLMAWRSAGMKTFIDTCCCIVTLFSMCRSLCHTAIQSLRFYSEEEQVWAKQITNNEILRLKECKCISRTERDLRWLWSLKQESTKP